MHVIGGVGIIKSSLIVSHSFRVNMPQQNLKHGLTYSEALDILKIAREEKWNPAKLEKSTGWSINSCIKYLENPKIVPPDGMGAPKTLTEKEEASFIETIIGLNQAGSEMETKATFPKLERNENERILKIPTLNETNDL